MLKLLQENQECWPQVLPGILFAYRTSKQSSTGFTPFFLLYGRTAKLPIECTQSESEDQSCQGVAKEIIDDLQPDEIKQRLEVIMSLRGKISKKVAENILDAQEKQRRDYQARHKSKQDFEVGDKVLVWNTRRADRKGGKMSDPWLGPYIVNKVCKNSLYQLRNERNEVLKSKQHGVNLKLFFERDATTNENNELDEQKEESNIPNRANSFIL